MKWRQLETSLQANKSDESSKQHHLFCWDSYLITTRSSCWSPRTPLAVSKTSCWFLLIPWISGLFWVYIPGCVRDWSTWRLKDHREPAEKLLSYQTLRVLKRHRKSSHSSVGQTCWYHVGCVLVDVYWTMTNWSDLFKNWFREMRVLYQSPSSLWSPLVRLIWRAGCLQVCSVSCVHNSPTWKLWKWLFGVRKKERGPKTHTTFSSKLG